MVRNLALSFIFILVASSLWAQDERYYRQILAGELPKLTEESKEGSVREYSIQGALYHIDLNGDGIEEILRPEKRDGIDTLVMMNSSRNVLFESKLLAMGGASVLYKIKLVHISKDVKALILFLDEGKTEGRKFESTARIFVIAIENNDLKNLKLTEGPHFFHEKEGQREQYWRRDYQVNVTDINGDGKREILVVYNHINRIMEYVGSGEWKRY